MILKSLGIYGWKESDENLVLASLLTGDPLLLIGNHGCAKTHIANKIAEAMGRKFVVYDASKSLFEDILGFPHVEKLKKGIVEYVSSPITAWDKELVVIDEVNRSLLENQSRFLEIIRSRRIMGFPTQIKWVWAAMNPIGYAGTERLDEALIGRFAIFLYPPDVLQMSQEDRIQVTTHINGDDAPSLSEWITETNVKSISQEDTQQAGEWIQTILSMAAQHFIRLREEMTTLSEFLAKFAELALKESKGEIVLDGRRLGFLYRNLLANRAIELAKSELFQSPVRSFAESAKYAIQSGIPIGLNEASLNREEALHTLDICFDLLSRYFETNSEIGKIERIYELFTADDLIRKAAILLTEDLGDFVHCKAWNDLIRSGREITLLAYLALQAEAHQPGTIPSEMVESLSAKIEDQQLSSLSLPELRGENIEFLDEIEALLEQPTELGRLIAFNRARNLIKTDSITRPMIAETRTQIQDDIRKFDQLIHPEQTTERR